MINLAYDFLYYMAFGQKFEFYFFVIFSTMMMLIRIFQLVSLPIIAQMYNIAFFIILSTSLNSIVFHNPTTWVGGNFFFGIDTATLKFLTIAFWFSFYFFIKTFFFEEFFEKNEFKIFSFDIALCGALYFVSATNLLEIFLGLELLAFPTYTLIGLEKTKAATEAALKYFIYSVYGSLLVILSFVVLFVVTGQTSFNDFVLFTDPYSAQLALMLFCTAFIVKLGVGPFYHWAPPVYQAVSSPVFIFISTISKVPLLAAFVYLAKSALILPNTWAMSYICFLLILGGLMSAKDLLSEDNIRRILAYTSNINFTIGLLGYFLGMFNVKVFLIYTTLYLISNLSVYIWHLVLNSNKLQKEEISKLPAFKKENSLGVFMTNAALIMNSGLPPLTIFFFKLLVVGNIIFWPTSVFNLLGFFIAIFILFASLSSYNAYFKVIKNISYRKSFEVPDLYEEPALNQIKIFQFGLMSTLTSVYFFVIALYFN